MSLIVPKISLVVCFHHEDTLLRRLLIGAQGAFDDLVVVHDGQLEFGKPLQTILPPIDYSFENEKSPNGLECYVGKGDQERTPISDLVTELGGQYYEGVHASQQEPHWPFAWSKARHDWILRLDADEIPSDGMLEWLHAFRRMPQVDENIAGYTCSWPLWDGVRATTERWPLGRTFLFHRKRVRFFGMVEQFPVPDTYFKEVPLILDHRPSRKSYGIRNVLVRRQAYRWRKVIAESLLGSPLELPRWRWTEDCWPEIWEQVRRQPVRTSFIRLIRWPLQELRSQWRTEGKIVLTAALNSGLHHFLICWAFVFIRLSRAKYGR